MELVEPVEGQALGGAGLNVTRRIAKAVIVSSLGMSEALGSQAAHHHA
jgi:hypothetical protein